MNEELTSYDKIATVLLKRYEEATSLPFYQELTQKDRWILCVSKLLEDPMIIDKDLITFLMTGCDGSCEPASQAIAYRNLAAIRRLIGNIQLVGKNWYRYMVTEAAKEGIHITREAKDPEGVAASTDRIGKYARSDKEDDDVGRSAWEPPRFEPSDDVMLVGDNFKPIPNLEEERKSFRALFKRDHDIVDIEPVTDDYGTGD